MENRDTFLADIARRLGRNVSHTPEPLPEVEPNYAKTRLTDLNAQQRCDAFITVATDVMLAHCELTGAADAGWATLRLCDKYGHAPVIVSGDRRLAELGITELLQQKCQATVWNSCAGEDDLRLAAQAKIGVIYAEYGLTESGSVVLFCAPDRGTAISLLPESSIFVLRKSTLLPRVAQLAQLLHMASQRGEPMPYCINIIGGPSSTADIELIKVVGVHGPINAAYLIIEDC
ncbi:lactate utilization protein C [Acerihabitans sp. TG2]|uniref:LutC/YkgG family protein n=1 Tax=Acerihabitans sp. TG2 TaxID=3096008 RepID=UPI002B23B238|nr:lactate utilization protein C [Acerihabitans sp. TG2]MEA9391592.1 lactate utilization protein C [Acerihabitans sp. TG2]